MTAAALTPALEERQARRRHSGLQKARRARDRQIGAARRAAARRAYAQLRDAGLLAACRCGLRPGMALADLRALGAGCCHPRFVCPALDAYRRRLER